MESSGKKSILKYFTIEAGIVLVVVIVILGILLYLGIIPFRTSPVKHPLSAAPPSQGKIANKIKPSTTLSDEKSYGCIFSGKLCAQSETITATNGYTSNFYGLGFTNIPQGTPIKAAISGRIGIGLATDPKTNTKINSLSIRNDSLHVEVDYSYIGKPFDPATAGGDISKGEIIGRLGESNVTFRQNPKSYSLIFSVMDLTNKEFKKIQPSDLK